RRPPRESGSGDRGIPGLSPRLRPIRFSLKLHVVKFGRNLPQRTVVAATLMVLAGLAACSRNAPPAPVEVNSVSRSPQVPPSVATAPTPVVAAAPAVAMGGRDTLYVVQRGDTTYAIARRFDIPVKGIIDANNLQPPYNVQAGQRLTIPRPRG